MLNKSDAKNLITKITASTKYYAVAMLAASEQGTTRFANSEISQNVTITNGTMSLTLYDGKKQVTCTTNALIEAGMEQLVRDAEYMLQAVPEGEFGAFLFSTEEIPERDTANNLAVTFDAKGRVALIKEGVAHLEVGYTASGALTLNSNVVAVGNSDGGFRYAAYDSVTFNTVVTHQDGTDGAGECTSYTNVPDIVGVFKKAQATSKAARNPVEPQLGWFTVVLSPNAFADLINFTAMSLNAKSVEMGISFASGKLGEKVFGENLTFCDDANHPDLMPVPFDNEGNPRRQLSLVDKGVVNAYTYDNKTAARAGTQSTGHSGGMFGPTPRNIVVAGGEQSMDEIIANTENGIYINELHYTNFVNSRNLQITGLTRNGTFLIENGQITKPIATVRFTESMLDAFNNITAISNERELVAGYVGAALVPGVRIENFHFTSKP